MWILPIQKEGFFNDDQLKKIKVLFNTIQPGDAERRIPNAEQSGAVNYIDLLLARDVFVFQDIGNWRNLYPIALEELDNYSLNKFAKHLEYLTSEESVKLISSMEKGELVPFDNGINQVVLFDTLRRHCIQGCFCDPKWGGNTDKIMWKWYGYLEESKNNNIKSE